MRRPAPLFNALRPGRAARPKLLLLLAAVVVVSLLFLLPLVGPTALPAPKAAPEPSAIDRDHEFDTGSKIELPTGGLTPQQIENLATLGRVWGFLKYHHPQVTSGQLHWDYELFRVMPALLAAANRDAANDALAQWIDRLGELAPGPNPPLADTALHLRPGKIQAPSSRK